MQHTRARYRTGGADQPPPLEPAVRRPWWWLAMIAVWLLATIAVRALLR